MVLTRKKKHIFGSSKIMIRDNAIFCDTDFDPVIGFSFSFSEEESVWTVSFSEVWSSASNSAAWLTTALQDRDSRHAGFTLRKEHLGQESGTGHQGRPPLTPLWGSQGTLLAKSQLLNGAIGSQGTTHFAGSSECFLKKRKLMILQLHFLSFCSETPSISIKSSLRQALGPDQVAWGFLLFTWQNQSLHSPGTCTQYHV